MASDTRPGSLELPPELWQRILRDETGITLVRPQQLKALSLVCRLFADICQTQLFQRLSMSLNVGVSFKNPYFDRPEVTWRSPGAKHWPVQEWEWAEWEKNMCRCFLWERKLGLIGSHRFLSNKPQKLRICGYGQLRCGYPVDPFQPPSEKQMLSKAIFDALHQLRQTLLKQLPALTSLRRLELHKYPVDNKLLAAMDLHPSLAELRFDFCWFPESPAPLTSITSLSFGTIPGHHFSQDFYGPGYDPYKGVPDHHLTSAFALISPPHIQELQVTFGSDESEVEPVLAQLCTGTSDKGDFLSLHSLSWRFWGSGVKTVSHSSSLVYQFLKRAPALRKLDIQGSPPPLPLNTRLPPRSMPSLQTIFSPLEWATSIVPGRPVNDIRVYLGDDRKPARFFSQTEPGLEDFLHPLTLSTVPVMTLHLPAYPPVAPASQLFPYLTTKFPLLRDLRVAVAEEKVASLPIEWLCGTRSGGPMPSTDTSDQIVEEGLMEMLKRDVRVDVERALTGTNSHHSSDLPPILDRIMAFRGIKREEPTTREDAVGQRSPNPPTIVQQPGSWPNLVSRSPSISPADDPPGPAENPLARFSKHFEEIDDVPLSKPQTELVSWFLSNCH